MFSEASPVAAPPTAILCLLKSNIRFFVECSTPDMFLPPIDRS